MCWGYRVRQWRQAGCRVGLDRMGWAEQGHAFGMSYEIPFGNGGQSDDGVRWTSWDEEGRACEVVRYTMSGRG
jgi:hypothetical protein